MTTDMICVEPPGQWLDPSLREVVYESFVHNMLTEMEAESGDSNLQEVLIKVWNKYQFDEMIGIIPDADYKLQEDLQIAEGQLSKINLELRKVHGLLMDLQLSCAGSKAVKIVAALKHIQKEAS